MKKMIIYKSNLVIIEWYQY